MAEVTKPVKAVEHNPKSVAETLLEKLKLSAETVVLNSPLGQRVAQAMRGQESVRPKLSGETKKAQVLAKFAGELEAGALGELVELIWSHVPLG